jgi:hypothetical protein
MSSRSDVIIAISKKVEIPSNVEDAISDADSIYETDEAKYWYWESVKWHSFDPSVKLVEDFLRQIENYELYGFIEIGEYGIITEGNPYNFGIGYTQQITKPWEDE